MGWIRKRNDKGTYEASYRDPAGSVPRASSRRQRLGLFSLLPRVPNSAATGQILEERRSALGEFADAYLASAAHLRPGTRVKVEGHLRNHIYPFFDKTPLGTIKPAHVRSWIAALEKEGLAPGTINVIYRTFFKVLKTAVIDGLISRSPCVGIDLPKQTTHEEMNFLTPEQVEALAQSIQPRYRALIFTAAYTGMRWGELAALKVERLNLLRGTVDVVESMSEINGYLQIQPTKTGRPRTLSLPRSLCELLGEHLGYHPSESGFVFSSPEGKPLRRNFYNRHYLPALVRSGLDPDLCLCRRSGCDRRHRPRYRFHDLRHTCAALLIAQGAHPKEIQERLGHSTITLTFRSLRAPPAQPRRTTKGWPRSNH